MASISGAHNPNWKGGRTITEHGYVLIRVGKDHHLSDVRGYAYEHRIVAEEKTGRRLLSNELVHHINDIRADNRPENLEVYSGNAEHFVHHRKRTDLRLPGETNTTVGCACGCGTLFNKYDNEGRPRRFVSGHNQHSAPTRDLILQHLTNGQMHSHELSRMSASMTHKSVRCALTRLRKEGKVIPVGDGRWALNI